MNSKTESQEKERLAFSQGETYSLALEKMKEDDVHASKYIEDYIISIACENAEGMFMYDDEEKLMWMIPHEGDNQHFEVVVQDKKDKRFLPGLEVSAKIFDESQILIAELEVPFIWHPFLFHYGLNFKIPKAGDYIAEVTVLKPTFHRHDEEVGKRYENDVTVTLGPVHLVPGRKEHGPE